MSVSGVRNRQNQQPVRAPRRGFPGSSARQKRRHRIPPGEWQGWDWSKQDCELAEETGHAHATITAIRQRVGAPKSPRYHQRRPKFKEPNLSKWRSWDWSKQNGELGREQGLSSERIRQIRQLLGAPKSPRHRRHPPFQPRTVLALQWAVENLDRLKGLTGVELRRKHVFGRNSQVYAFLKAKGVLRRGRAGPKHPWHLMNFALPNGTLQRIWKLRLYGATCQRCRKHLSASRWTLVGGAAALPRGRELRAYNRAVQAEKRKAARYFAERDRLCVRQVPEN